MMCVMVLQLGLIQWLGVENLRYFFASLGIIGVAIFLMWIYFQFGVKGIRSISRRNLFGVSTSSLICFVIGTICYVLRNNLIPYLGFLGEYNELLYSILIIVGLVLLVIALLIYYGEVKWQRKIRAKAEHLKKETEILQKSVESVDTKKEEVESYIDKTQEEIGKYREIYDEFQKT